MPTPAYIATAVDGSPLHPERLTRTFEQLRKLVGLRPTRLHDLRHALRDEAAAGGRADDGRVEVMAACRHPDHRQHLRSRRRQVGLEASDVAVGSLGLG